MDLQTAINNGFRIAYWHETNRHIVMFYKATVENDTTYITYAASIHTPPGNFIKKTERGYALERLNNAPVIAPVIMPLEEFLTLEWPERKAILRNLLFEYSTYAKPAEERAVTVSIIYSPPSQIPTASWFTKFWMDIKEIFLWV